jgi:hypothetical protein
MGLLRALAALPLAPLKGVAALADHIQEQADREQVRELAELQALLLELQLSSDSEEETEAREDELLEKLGALVGAGVIREEE